MILQGQPARRGIGRALSVEDMSFGSYEGRASRNAAQLIAETGRGAVTIEGGEGMAETI